MSRAGLALFVGLPLAVTTVTVSTEAAAAPLRLRFDARALKLPVPAAFDAREDLKSAYNKALGQYNNLELDAAKSTLESALSGTAPDDPATAPLRMLNAVIIFSNTGKADETTAAFTDAVKSDYNVTLPTELRSAELQKLLDKARKASGVSDSSEAVQHTAPAIDDACGKDVVITALARSVPEGGQVALYWRQAGGGEFKTSAMDIFGNYAAVTLTAADHGDKPIEYFFYVFDSANKDLGSKGDQDNPLKLEIACQKEAVEKPKEVVEAPKPKSGLPRVFINIGLGTGAGIARGVADQSYKQLSPADGYTPADYACSIARWQAGSEDVPDATGFANGLNNLSPGQYAPYSAADLALAYNADDCAAHHPWHLGRGPRLGGRRRGLRRDRRRHRGRSPWTRQRRPRRRSATRLDPRRRDHLQPGAGRLTSFTAWCVALDPDRLGQLGRRGDVVMLAEVEDRPPCLLGLFGREVVAAGDPRVAVGDQAIDPVRWIAHQIGPESAAPKPGRRRQTELDGRGQHRLAQLLVLDDRQAVDLEQPRQVVLLRRRVEPLERRERLRRAHQVTVRPLRQCAPGGLHPLFGAHTAQRVAGRTIRVGRELARAQLALRRLEAHRRVTAQALGLDLAGRRRLAGVATNQQLQAERLRQAHEDLAGLRLADVDDRVDHRDLAEVRGDQPNTQQRKAEPAQQHRSGLQRRRAPHAAGRLVEHDDRRDAARLEREVADQSPLDLRAEHRTRGPAALSDRLWDPRAALVGRRQGRRTGCPKGQARLQQPRPDLRRTAPQLVQVGLQDLEQLAALVRRQHQRRLLGRRRQLEPGSAALGRPLARLAVADQRPRLAQPLRQRGMGLGVDPAPAGHRAVRAASAGIRHIGAPGPLVAAGFHPSDHSASTFVV